MKNTILKFGLLSGLVAAGLMLLSALWFSRSGNMAYGAAVGYTGMIISMIVVFFGVRSYRDKERNGRISFGEAFKIGGLMALVSCLIYVIGWLLVYEFVMPDFMDKYMTFTLEGMRAAGKSDNEIQQAAADLGKMKAEYDGSVLVRIAYTFLEPLPTSLLGTLVSALVLKKQ
ncbi:MAG: DUF4199 domain-containing protein [Chitinophagales bacterium]|nr:DUF4199 domain-containing protein [Chitinophagales bacterium]